MTDRLVNNPPPSLRLVISIWFGCVPSGRYSHSQQKKTIVKCMLDLVYWIIGEWVGNLFFYWRTDSRECGLVLPFLIYLFILGLRSDFPSDEILFGCTNRVAELFQVGANLVIHLMHNTLPRQPVPPARTGPRPQTDNEPKLTRNSSRPPHKLKLVSSRGLIYGH